MQNKTQHSGGIYRLQIITSYNSDIVFLHSPQLIKLRNVFVVLEEFAFWAHTLFNIA